MVNNFRVLRSSAGAGKTHTLVKEYLKCCLVTIGRQAFRPNAFRHVLALTFTNKAAAEMQERVLEYVSALALEEDHGSFDGPMADVAQELLESCGISPQELQARCEAMLKQMLHDRSAMAVSTIDAFTKKLTRPFTRELQLDWDQELTDDQELIDSLAADAMLDSLELGGAESRIIMQACEELIEQEDSWDLRKPLREMAKKLTDETALRQLRFYQSLSADQILQLAHALRERINTFMIEWRTTATNGAAILEKIGIPEELMSHKAEVQRKLKEHSTIRDLEYNVARWIKTLSSGNLISASNKKEKAHFEADIEALEPIGNKLKEMMQDRFIGDVFIPQSVLKKLMMVATMSDLAEHLDLTKKEEGVVYFSDLTQKVAKVVQLEPTPFVFERIGERFKHVMVDEFQDTSIMQWQNLIPLAEEALSNGGSVLLVGDAKQAIYRWRNGEVRQIQQLPSIFSKDELALGDLREHTFKGHFQKTEPLSGNYRSGKSIVEFNNSFFDFAKRHSFENSSKGLTAVERDDLITSVFEQHEQEVKIGRTGFVEARHYPQTKPKTNTVEKEQCLEQVLEVIKEVCGLGYRKSDVSILVRSQKTGRQVAEHLSGAGIKVNSSESFLLGNDLNAQLICDQLSYLDDPLDSTAGRIHSLLSVLGLRQDILVRESNLDKPKKSVEQLLSDIRSRRSGMSLYVLCNALIDLNGQSASTDMMLLALLDFAQAHGNYGNAGVRSFLGKWERSLAEKGVELARDHDSVEILTIHKSKGLARPVIIVPFGDMRSINTLDSVWMELPEYGLESALIQPKKELVDKGYPKVMEEKLMRDLDEINMLYVAATRASHRLYMFLPGNSQSQVSKALQQFIEQHGQDGIFVSGNSEEAFVPKEEGIKASELCEQDSEGESKLVFRNDAPEGWSIVDSDPFNSRLGDEIHTLFERLENVDQIERAIAQASALSPLDDALKEKLVNLLKKPEVRAFYEPGLDANNEATILLDVNKTLRPDRVVFDGKNAKVLDIKTGKKLKKHREQVAGYKDALRELGFQNVEGYLLYVSDAELVSV